MPEPDGLPGDPLLPVPLVELPLVPELEPAPEGEDGLPVALLPGAPLGAPLVERPPVVLGLLP